MAFHFPLLQVPIGLRRQVRSVAEATVLLLVHLGFCLLAGLVREYSQVDLQCHSFWATVYHQQPAHLLNED